MKCAFCNHENNTTDAVCSNCGKPIAIEPPPIQTVIPRQMPYDNNSPPGAYNVCAQCGNIFQETEFLCNVCGSDFRNRNKKASAISAKGCFTSLIKRLLGMAFASFISFGVGWVSVALGFGEFFSKIFTTIVSTMVSFVPVLIGWVRNNSKPSRTTLAVFLLLVILFSPTLQLAKAQTSTPTDILETFLNQINGSVVKWEPDSDSIETTVYFKSATSSGNSTNAAKVVNLQDAFGSTGGQQWVDAYLEILETPESDCTIQPYSLYESRAYFFECSPDNSYRAGIMWESGAWAAAVYNFVYPVGDYSVEYLSEQLYPLLPVYQGSPNTPPDENISETSAEAWTQDDINRMAIQVLDDYAAAKDWPANSPCTSYFGCNDPEKIGVFVYEQRNTELVERGLIGSPTLQSVIQSGEASFYRRPQLTEYPVIKGGVYNHISILYYPDEQALNLRLSDIYQGEDFNGGDSFEESLITLQNDFLSFHGQDAVMKRMVLPTTIPDTEVKYIFRREIFAWVQYPWLFSIEGQLPYGGESQTIDDPLFDVEKDPELLYLLASQAGMFNPPVTTNAPNAAEVQDQVIIAEPTPQIQFSEEEIADMNEDDLLSLASMLAPSALLPALGVAGLSLLLDLLKRKPKALLPEGMALSPFPGFGKVSTEVAAHHANLIQQGYSYNLGTGKLQPPMFKSPFDGRLIPKHEYERELGLKSQGFLLQGDQFVLPEYLSRDKRWEEGQQKSYEGSLPTREKMLLQEQQKALEEQQRQQRMEYLRSAIPQMEEQAERDYRSSQILQQDAIGTIWKASQMTARTVVTGVDHNGNFSVAAFGVRLLAAGVSAGASEFVMNSADFGYRTYDGVQSGKSLPEAAVDTSIEMGQEWLMFKVGGKAVTWAAKRKLTVTMANYIREGASSIADTYKPLTTTLLDPALDKAKNVYKSLFGGNQLNEITEDKVRALYRNNGSKTLRELESKGLISPSEARTISKLITKDVNEAVYQATPDTIRSFEKLTGIKVKSVMVADSGSSSTRSFATRSVYSDFDRAILLEVDNDSLNSYAKQLMKNNSALTQSQAREMAQNELQSQFKKLHQNQMDQQLSKIGLTTEDVKYNNYNGLSGDPEMGDSYPAGYNRTRMANQGEAVVFRPNSSGEIVSAKMTGQQVVDQEALSKINITGAQGQQAADIINLQQPIINKVDALKVLAEQNTVANKSTDPLSLAKALLRADKAQRILSGVPGTQVNGPPKIPESILRIAEGMIKNPQQSTNQIPPTFVRDASEQIKNLFSVANQ